MHANYAAFKAALKAVSVATTKPPSPMPVLDNVQVSVSADGEVTLLGTDRYVLAQASFATEPGEAKTFTLPPLTVKALLSLKAGTVTVEHGLVSVDGTPVGAAAGEDDGYPRVSSLIREPSPSDGFENVTLGVDVTSKIVNIAKAVGGQGFTIYSTSGATPRTLLRVGIDIAPKFAGEFSLIVMAMARKGTFTP